MRTPAILALGAMATAAWVGCAADDGTLSGGIGPGAVTEAPPQTEPGAPQAVPNGDGTTPSSEMSPVGAPLDGDPMAPAGEGMPPWSQPLPVSSMVRKVKNVLTGLAPTDDELLQVSADPGALRGLVDQWMETPQFGEKMIFFFQNAFQQSSLAVLDFEFQLRKRPGAFDLPYNIFGDDAYPLLFKNLKESFARTALELVRQGRPLNEVLTTRQFMLTTALASLYMQIEMPYDIRTQSYRYNQGRRPPIEETLDPNSPNYLVFGYEPPTTSSGSRQFNGTCAGDATKVSTYPGNTHVFWMLLGSVGRDSGNNSSGTSNLGCMEHAAKPYFTAQDLSDWRMVTITEQGQPIRSFDLPRLRAATTLPSRLPRVGFFTTPAFLAVWNTNDSNQHRVTANQALLVALGQGYTSASAAIPVPSNLAAVDGQHAVNESTCYGCHKSLDPMRQFWENFYDYNEKPQTGANGPSAAFAFGDVVSEGETLEDFGNFVSQITDWQVQDVPVNRFALAMTQKLCFFANSAKCDETDPEVRRVALAFESSNYDFKTLLGELLTSPLVTAVESTQTAAAQGVTISIARRDQLCAVLSTRLQRPDLCENAMPAPTNIMSATARLAGALPADGFSRGTEFPVTPPDPNLFYSAASELLCEAIARKVVDAGNNTVFSSADASTAIERMVTDLMGVPAADPNHTTAVDVLTRHHETAVSSAGANPTDALRSTFSAACQSAATLSMGI